MKSIPSGFSHHHSLAAGQHDAIVRTGEPTERFGKSLRDRGFSGALDRNSRGSRFDERAQRCLSIFEEDWAVDLVVMLDAQTDRCENVVERVRLGQSTDAATPHAL
jgi:hypothetical protein